MSKRKHKTELRTREIKQSYCADPRCKFFGQYARQGICFDAPEPEDWIRKYERQSAALRAEREDARKRYRGKPREYIRHLEAHYECAMLNWILGLDEVVLLRRDNELLRDAAARRKNKTAL